MTEEKPARRWRPSAIALLGMAALIAGGGVAVALNAAGAGPSVRSGVASAGGSSATTAGGSTDSYTVTGPRPAPIVYRPPGLSRAQKVGLVVAFYGATGTPQRMEGLTKFERIAREHGFVVGYPGSQTDPPWHAPDDTAYVGSLIDRIVAHENIDPKRIYLTGFSAGGRETYFLGCGLSAKVAAIAVVSSVMRDYPCPIAHPISELTIDASGEAITGTSNIPSAASVAAHWRALNGCPAQVAVKTTQVATVTQQMWGPCAAGSTVGIWIVQGGHHTWPGSYGLAASDPDAQFDASEAIWAFFAAHPLPG